MAAENKKAMQSSGVIHVLRHCALFAGLDDSDLQILAQGAVKRKYKKANIVFFERDQGIDLFLVLEGKVAAVRVDPHSGNKIVYNVFEKGQVFGEMACLDGLPRSADMETWEKDTVVLIIKGENVRRVLETSMGLNRTFNQLLVDKLRKATDQVDDLRFQKVHTRVARYLHWLAYYGGPNDSESRDTGGSYRDVVFLEEFFPALRKRDAPGLIDASYTHEKIADIVGASREMVTRSIGRFEEEGYIRREGNRIRIAKALPLD